VIAASAYSGHGPNPNLDVALGGIVAAGVLYGIIALIVMQSGVGWVDRLMPPVVTGAVVAVIGLNLAPVAVKAVSGSQFDACIGLITVVIVGLVAVSAPGLWRRLPVIIGAIAGYLLYLLLANVLGLGKPIDYAALAAAPWIGLPKFTAPSFHANAVFLIAPVAIILVAENLGHIKAIGAMTGRSLDPFLGRAFLGDSLATIVSALGGGPGVTTYAENIGVMAATRVYSTLLFVVAAVVSILLGFSPKFGALILSIPAPVIGGLSLVLFGLIAAMAGRIWVENRVDFSNPQNLIAVATALTAGAGDLTLKFGSFTMGGIAPRRSVRSSSIKSSAGPKPRNRFLRTPTAGKASAARPQPVTDVATNRGATMSREFDIAIRALGCGAVAIGSSKSGSETVTS
jgi:uracil-xanthine permease